MLQRVCRLVVVVWGACAVSGAWAQPAADADREARRAQIKQCRALLKDALPRIGSGAYDTALVLLDSAARCDPENPDVFYHTARVRLRLADTADAVAALTAGVERAPLSRRLKMLLARLKIAQGAHGEAADLLAKVLAIKPREGEALFLKGLVLLAAADTAQALDTWRQALDLELGDEGP